MIRKALPYLLTLGGLILIIFGVACGSNITQDSISLTLTPMSASIKGTATARSASEGSNDELATAVVKATRQAEIVYGTQTAEASLNEPSRLATATAIAPVVAELPRYGIDPSDGYVAWLHPPVTIDLQGYQQTGYANDFQNITAVDFVIAADITWTTMNSESGCGFMFRSNADTNQPSQYVVLISRLASGQMAFLGMVDGKISNFHSFFPKDRDKVFNWFNGATNRLAVVARGTLIDLFTNGEWIGQVDITQPPSTPPSSPPAVDLPPGASDDLLEDYNNQLLQMDSGLELMRSQLAEAQKNHTTSQVVVDEGFLGFIGMSQSGTMTCTFGNGWLFILK